MKIAVVLPCNLYGAPFYRRYESILNEKGIEFDLIYWNRAQIDERAGGNVISFNLSDDLLSGKKTKIFKYFKFVKFAKDKLKNGKYDRVFILGSYGGIMAFLSLYLKSHYKKRYWLDIRDYSFEKIKLYLLAMKVAIDNSYTTAISSQAFKQFLPESEYTLVHNIDWNNIKKVWNSNSRENKSDMIRISYIGLIGFYEENKKLLSALKNDKRFRIQYYGANSEVLKKYCEDEKIHNVDFYGRFASEETSSFYLKTDIINNVYGNDNINLRTALSNKLYFSAALQIPILVSPNTFMAKIASEYGFGFIMDYNNVSLADKLYEWYVQFISCDRTEYFLNFWNRAESEDALFEKKVLEFIGISKERVSN